MTIRRHRDDSGFTLIEVLLVTVILGILSAIALPAMASQKDKARRAAMKSSLRHAATFQESRMASGEPYAPPGPAGLVALQLEGFKITDGVDVTIIDDDMTASGHGFCMSAAMSGMPTIYYSSTAASKFSDIPCVES